MKLMIYFSTRCVPQGVLCRFWNGLSGSSDIGFAGRGGGEVPADKRGQGQKEALLKLWAMSGINRTCLHFWISILLD